MRTVLHTCLLCLLFRCLRDFTDRNLFWLPATDEVPASRYAEGIHTIQPDFADDNNDMQASYRTLRFLCTTAELCTL